MTIGRDGVYDADWDRIQGPAPGTSGYAVFPLGTTGRHKGTNFLGFVPFAFLTIVPA